MQSKVFYNYKHPSQDRLQDYSEYCLVQVIVVVMEYLVAVVEY